MLYLFFECFGASSFRIELVCGKRASFLAPSLFPCFATLMLPASMVWAWIRPLGGPVKLCRDKPIFDPVNITIGRAALP